MAKGHSKKYSNAEFKMPSLGADTGRRHIDRMEKPGDTKRGDIIAEVVKGLIELKYSMKASLINSIQEGTKVPVGTVMALLQPSDVSLDTKKKRSCPQPNRKKNQKSTPASTAEIRKIKVSPLARRIAEETSTRISGRNRS
jgi:pyruvate dehydrogenase E2 component (dihydrolipoamide acetyltransferase)